MPRISPQFLTQDVLNAQQVRDEQFRFINIIPAIQDNKSAMHFLARLGLLRNHVRCGVCGNPCRINAYSQGTDGFRWRCNAHNFTQSIRTDSFFDKSHLTLSQLVIILYLWARDSPQKEIAWEATCSKQTVIDWCNFIRELCEQHIKANPQELGRSRRVDDYDDSEKIDVEKDESKYLHQKCKGGQLKRAYGTSQVLFPSYLSEFLWRNKNGNFNVFGELINTIRGFYVL